jgi:uncharacterized protein (DUF488 family)
VPPTIYTIGSSTRTWEVFLAVLAAYGIRALVDVRRFPVSRRYPHFTRDHLGAELPPRGISYHWLGQSLGGYRTGGYEGYTRTAAYRDGIAALEVIGRECATAFLCAERLPSQCHRRFIAATLEQRGWQVVHILERDRLWGSSDRRPSIL